MKLVYFSVSNFRSITKGDRLPIGASTILTGKNNEGKSNILYALTTAMELIGQQVRVRGARRIYRRDRIYDWERDFPIQLQGRKSPGKTMFRLEFELSLAEVEDFKSEIGSSLNGTLPIEVSIGKDAAFADFRVIKKGPGSQRLTKKSGEIAEFIGSRINLVYIPAVRTSGAAINVVEQMISERLQTLDSDPMYQQALDKIRELQEPILRDISDEITGPLRQFLPQVKNVNVSMSQDMRYRAVRGGCEIVIDDGVQTPLERKGDGVKSLAAISLLRGSKDKGKNTILALEEPESHLHPSAIHRLRNVIDDLVEDYQVVVTTHCPIFVDRINISRNVIISESKARVAKKISDVREVLGVRAADNLFHARLVLIVEGQDDKISLTSIFKQESRVLYKALRDGVLCISYTGGCGNLTYQIGLYQSVVCDTFVYFDNDVAGRDSVDKAERTGLLRVSDYKLATCIGMVDSEFEDIIDVDVYNGAIFDKYGVDLKCKEFKNNRKKWSDRVRDAFKAQGKIWNDNVESEVKMIVANVLSVSRNFLCPHKRASIDSLIGELERRISSMG